jgi:hypothetical protein
VENALSNPTNEANKIIKMSTAKIAYRKYKSICKQKYKIQPKYKENCNDHMRIYIVSTVGIYTQKYNISPETRMFLAYQMKKL